MTIVEINKRFTAIINLIIIYNYMLEEVEGQAKLQKNKREVGEI